MAICRSCSGSGQISVLDTATINLTLTPENLLSATAPVEILFSYAGTLASTTESPPIRVRRAGILDILAVTLTPEGITYSVAPTQNHQPAEGTVELSDQEKEEYISNWEIAAGTKPPPEPPPPEPEPDPEPEPPPDLKKQSRIEAAIKKAAAPKPAPELEPEPEPGALTPEEIKKQSRIEAAIKKGIHEPEPEVQQPSRKEIMAMERKKQRNHNSRLRRGA